MLYEFLFGKVEFKDKYQRHLRGGEPLEVRDLMDASGFDDPNAGESIETIEVRDVEADVLKSANLGSVARKLASRFGLEFAGRDYLNWGGKDEKWMKNSSGDWFYILNDGSLYQWHGGELSNRTQIAMLDDTYYKDTSKLYDAQKTKRAASSQILDKKTTTARETENVYASTLAYDFDQALQFEKPRSVYFDWAGLKEKWLQSEANGKWHFITPEGNLYAWNGGPIISAKIIASLDPSFHTDLSLLYDARNPAESHSDDGCLTHSAPTGEESVFAQRAYDLDQELQLEHMGNDFLDWGGLNEKWLRSGRNGKWYFFTPEGTFYEWNGGALTTGGGIATFDSSFYADTSFLYDATKPAESSTNGDDSTHDEVSFAIALQAFELDQMYGFRHQGNDFQNWGGRNEKWITDRDNNWRTFPWEGAHPRERTPSNPLFRSGKCRGSSPTIYGA